MRISRMAALCLIAPALAFAGCGGSDSDSDSDSDQITGIIEQVGDDPAVVCDHLSAATLEALGSVEDCKKAAEESGEKPDSGVKVNDVAVDGDKATAKITGKDGDQTVTFVKEDGDWKVNASS